MLENIRKSSLNLTALRGLSLSAMILALYVVLGFFKVPISPDNRISFTFVALVVSGYVLGPVPAMMIGALGDIIGFLAMPTGTFFPGYTISSALSGLIFGLCLYKKPIKHIFLWILLSRVLVTFGINLVLNTIWGSILYNKAINILLWARIFKNLIAFPIQIAVSYALILVIEKSGLKKKF